MTFLRLCGAYSLFLYAIFLHIWLQDLLKSRNSKTTVVLIAVLTLLLVMFPLIYISIHALLS